MFILLPISRIHLEKEIIIEGITISSYIAVNEKGICIDGNEYTLHEFNKEGILEIFGGGFAVYRVEETVIRNEQVFLEDAIKKVDSYLDCIRLNLNSYRFREQILGRPGYCEGVEQCVLLDHEFNIKKIIKGNNIYYRMHVGLGCDISDYEHNDYGNLLLKRNDDIYLKYCSILHRTVESMNLEDMNAKFIFLFSTVESMVPGESYGFLEKKKKILSCIATSQKEYDVLSKQFYFYSKIVRTKIVHSGESLHEILPEKKIYRLLDDLFFLVVNFCKFAIESKQTTIESLDIIIQQKVKLYINTKPDNEEKNEKLEGTYDGVGVYLAEINNLEIECCLKLGDALIIPNAIREKFNQLLEVYFYGVGMCDVYNIDEKSVFVTSDFPNYELFSDFNSGKKSFTVWDVDLIMTTLQWYGESEDTIIILENQYYWDIYLDKYSVEFSDIICNKLQEALNYMVLLNLKSNTVLPSKVGLNDSRIRMAHVNPEGDKRFYPIMGAVYDEYNEPIEKYVPLLKEYVANLYECFFSNKYNEVLIANKRALNRLAECEYFSNLNQKMIVIFEIVESLYPTTHDSNKLISRIATVCSNTIEERNEILRKLNNWKDTLRKRIIHGGKSLCDLEYTINEIESIYIEIQDIVIKYCIRVYLLNVESFEEMREAEKRIYESLCNSEIVWQVEK